MMTTRRKKSAAESSHETSSTLPLTTIRDLYALLLPQNGHHLTLDETAKRIPAKLTPLIPSFRIAIAVYDGRSRKFNVSAPSGFEPIDRLLSLSHSTIDWKTCAPIVLETDNLEYPSPREPAQSGPYVFPTASIYPFESTAECRGLILFLGPRPTNSITDTFRDLSLLTASLLGLSWNQQQRFIANEIFHEIALARDLEELGQRLCKGAISLLNGSAACFYIVDITDPDHLRLVNQVGFQRTHEELRRFPIDGSIAGRVASTGRTAFLTDLSTHPGVANRTVARHEGFKSSLVVAVSGRSILGSLALFTRDQRSFDSQSISLLEAAAEFAAAQIDIRLEAEQADTLRNQLTTVGHSLLAPLGRVSNLVAKLRSASPPADASHAKMYGAIFKEIDIATKRVQNILFAKSGVVGIMGLNITQVNIGDILMRCAARHEEAAVKRGIRLIVWDSAKRLPVFQADEVKIELAFDNIFENAVKYGWDDESINVRGAAEANFVQVSVSDKGLGVPDALYDAIFIAYRRSSILDAKRFIHGTGLGLDIVRSVVEAHGGTVSVTSTPFLDDPVRLEKYEGFETTFTVRLPRRH